MTITVTDGNAQFVANYPSDSQDITEYNTNNDFEGKNKSQYIRRLNIYIRRFMLFVQVPHK